MYCGRCEADLESPHEDGLFYDTEEIICPECRSVNQIGVDDSEPYEDAGHGTAYVSHWTCRHGADDETPCPECDAEDNAKEGARHG